MKRQVAKFVNAHFVSILTYPSLASVLIADSMIGLTFYSIIIHGMVVMLSTALLSDEESTALLSDEETFANNISRNLVNYDFWESIGFLIVLGITSHGYTLILTGIYAFLLFVNMYDRIFHKDKT